MPGLVGSKILGPRAPRAAAILGLLKVEAMVRLELRPVKKLCVEKQQVEESVKGPK